MTISRFNPIAGIWILFLSFPATCQNTKPIVKKTGGDSVPKAERREPEKTSGEVQERAVALVKSLLEESDSLSNVTGKVGLQARIGETLWGYDQRTARRAFNEALHAIDSMSSEKGRPPLSSNEDFYYRSQLRREVAEVIARLDSEWAKKIALSSITISDRKTSSRLNFHSIMSLSDADPRYAAELLRTNIDVHDATLLREVLMKIRPKQPALADDVFDYALSLAEKNLSQPFGYFFEVFGYVFPESRHQTEDSHEHSSSVASAPIDEALIRRFLAFGYRAIMQEADEIAKESGSISERSGYGYEYVMGMLPSFLPYMPDEAATMRARWNAVVGNLRDGKRTIRDWNLLRHPPSVESLLREAETTQRQEEKNAYYGLAAYRALSEGNFNRAISIVGKIPDEDDRNRQRGSILSKAAVVALDRGDLESAYRYGKEIVESYDRIEVMNGLLKALLDKKDSARATRILDEVLQTVAKDGDVEKANRFLNLAEIAIGLNPERGFAVTRSGVEALNSARMSDGTPYISSIDAFDRNLLRLARIDFSKALSLAQMLDNENLLFAELAVCRGVLTPASKAR